MEGLKQRIQIASGSQVAQSAQLSRVTRCRGFCEVGSRVFRPLIPLCAAKIINIVTEERLQHYYSFCKLSSY